MHRVCYPTAIGLLEIQGTDEGILSVLFLEEGATATENAKEATVPDCLIACRQQLDEYFRGTRRDFNVKLNPQGTQFQKQVWRKLPDIPFGQTASYKDIAEAVGNSKAVRAVGGANSQNPISIIVPCHRVIGSNGKLTGYAGGLWRKEWLLAHEQKVLTSPAECPR
ncbi:methylated-DNA--[protein]-cysteine S-methyltransferase [Heliobacillus mobilis]|uniref:Methylated-DNA--protein-cysteine methyltransferase n=1 Tax=Heliobacterium mobile TaxID=28064 RepID=A0A6I3SMM6_HELMO|nr:methylated-DNA--[protein]-cysteine S-methyltransferase [Heliobacterium mobile]